MFMVILLMTTTVFPISYCLVVSTYGCFIKIVVRAVERNELFANCSSSVRVVR